MGLLAERGNYSLDALIGWSSDSFARIELPGLEPLVPYALDGIDSGPCAVVATGFLKTRTPRLDVEHLVSVLKGRFDDVVLWDHADAFHLEVGPTDIRHFSRVVKINGIYRDPDHYNFDVGALSPTGQWMEKTDPRVGPKYEPATLDAIRLAPPCFLSCIPTVRNRSRRLYQPWLERLAKGHVDKLTEGWLRLGRQRQPKTTAHLVGALTQVQRRDGLRRLRGAGILTWGGITHVPLFIAGFGDRFGIAQLNTTTKSMIEEELQAEGLMMPARARPAYLSSMLGCKAVVSIAGYGEICFRMAEAWMSGRVLVCQNLSHARVDYPLTPGRNVVFCRPDLLDLPEILDDIECNWQRYRPIGEQGLADWANWAAGAAGIVDRTLMSLRG